MAQEGDVRAVSRHGKALHGVTRWLASAVLAGCGAPPPPSAVPAERAMGQVKGAERPVRHQRLPPPEAMARRTDQVAAAGDGLPTAIWGASGEVAAPQPARPGDPLPTYAARPPPHIGLDLRTQGDGELHYQMVFDPSVAPFKRELALDTVHEDLTLTASGMGREVLQPRTTERPGHELFWGHVRLQLVAGQAVGLPSVAPSSQVLAWVTEPPLSLSIDRDAAGNFRVVPLSTGTVDFRYLMDAPADYFAAPLGRGRPLAPPAQPPLPATVADRAQRLWPQLGVSAAADPNQNVSTLVEWFRGFQAGAPPAEGTDALASLVLGRRGVCRHRTLAFVVLARSLGVAAHYVTNDAHAFAEVWARRADGSEGWLRVDLGGAAQSLELHAADGKRLHRPQYPDPFAQPEAYVQSAPQAPPAGSASGPTPRGSAWAGAARVVGAEGLRDTTAAGDDSGASPDREPATLAAPSGELSRAQWLASRSSPAASDGPAVADGRVATTLRVEPPAATAWLGEPVTLRGQLRGAEGLSLPIELWLIDPAAPASGLLLGTVATAADGQFVAHLAIPADALPRAYDVVARFAGDLRRAPCDSGP
jgi:transglutaminase-like putative cysteine protease